MYMVTKMKNINELFGLRVKQARIAQGLSQEELAYVCGLHRTYIGQIERAEKNVTLKNIERIAKSLNLDIKELLDFSNLDQY